MVWFESRIVRIFTRTWHQRMASRGEPTSASNLWTALFPNSVAPNPVLSCISVHTCGHPGCKARLHPQQSLDHPKGLEVSASVTQDNFWIQTWKRRPWKVIWAEKSRDLGTRAMILKGNLMQVLSGHMVETCSEKCQRGSKACGPIVWVMQK